LHHSHLPETNWWRTYVINQWQKNSLHLF
jgi:hypothetical protein